MPRRLPRKAVKLTCTPLESRLTPTNLLGFLGPLTDEGMQPIVLNGIDAYTPLATIPASTAGATSYFSLAKYSAFSIDSARIGEHLGTNGTVLALPRPSGGFERFRVSEFQLLTPDFAAVRPDVKTYRGIGLDDPNAMLVADITPTGGFRAEVLTPNGTYYIDPYYHLSTSVFVSYFKQDNLSKNDFHEEEPPATGGAGTLGMGGGATELGPSPPVSLGTQLRTFRTAVAATGEYTTFQGGTVTAAQNAMITTMNRVSGVYEKELGVKLALINNTTIIYTNSASDPYTNGTPGTMINENQTNLDNAANVGSANYDIGHVFGTNSGGLAGLGVVGTAGQKARGVTGSGSPTGDSFDIDYVAHEMGHQFGGNHSFNGTQGSAAGNRNSSTAWEPGSGSSIMSYAGICGTDDLQSNSDAYFHIGNIGEIRTKIASIPTVGTTTASGNAVPVVSAGLDYTIPASTPFALTGSATDANGDPITYNWEEYDAVSGSTGTALGTYPTTNQVLFRSFNSTTSPTRTFPKLSSLLNNTSTTAELMPTTSRPLNFTLTARDTHAMTGPVGGFIGGIASDDMLVTVVNTGAAFTVTAPNTAVSWLGGSTQTVTWNVAGTTANGINAANVNILLSTDGGNTFTTTVLANTANDGSETIVVPNTATTQARIKVVPVNNIFFDISNVNFTITAGSIMQVNTSTPAANGTLVGPTATLDLNFSQPISAATLASTDLTVSAGTVTGVVIPAGLPNTARFTIGGLTGEGSLTANLAVGSVLSTTGNSTSAFSGNYAVDVGTVPFAPGLTAQLPLGSRVYSGTLSSAAINATGDTDSFTIDLDAGQTLTAVVVPGATLTPQVTLTGPGTNASASGTAAGKPAQLANAPITTAGTYTVTVAGLSSTSGSYTLQLIANGNAETETTTGTSNNVPAAAQTLDTAMQPLGGGALFGSVRGRFDGGSAADTEPNESFATATSAATSFNAYSGNLYHLGLSGSISTIATDVDYFNIGTLQAGDIITITETGSPSRSGNTLSDPLVSLYRGASTLVIDGSASQYDDGGVGLDSLIYRFTVVTADTYYIRAAAYSTSTGSTYTLGVQLENTGTAPTTGGSVVSETETNDTQATATNASGSWRAVQYLSTATGSISTTGDIDTFAYTFTAGDLVTINARSTSTLETEVRLLDSAGTPIAIEDGTSANTSSGPGLNSPVYAFRIPSTGTYYVDVQAVTSTGAYALDVYLSSTTPPVLPVDVYALTLTAGQKVALALKSQTAVAGTLELVDINSSVLATSTTGSTNIDRSLSYTAPANGIVYARVSAANTSDYVLTAAINAPLDLEPNDALATAQPLGTGNRAFGSLTSVNDDWYSLNLTAGNTVTLATNTPFDGAGLPANVLDARLSLYNSAGVLLASNSNGATDGRNALLSFPIILSGIYYVAISSELGTGGEYGMSMSVAPSTTGVSGFIINSAAAQRSRVTNITVQFSANVSPGSFSNPGDITLTRYAATSTGTVGTVVQTGATGAFGLISVSQPGPLNELLLSFSNADASDVTAGVEFGSLADGRWRLAIPSLSYLNPIGVSDPVIHRLFGDRDGNLTVDGSDFSFFPAFGANVGSPFDFNNNADIDGGTDFAQFGNRVGVTL